MKHRASRTILMMAALISCGEDDPLASSNPNRPYEDGATTVIGGDESMPVASGQVTPEGCLQVTSTNCVTVEREGKYCTGDEGPVDAVVVDGQVVEVVCYEDADGGGPSEVVDADQDGDIDVPQQGNGTVVTFDGTTDGKPIPGNITVDGNNVTLYGNGPDKTIIEGNLVITGNNARVRGIRVKGNVEISLNTAALVFSVVEGNLIVTSNNSLVAETDVFGKLSMQGNNGILVNNDVQGEWEVTGSNPTCDGNRAFSDADGDKIIEDGEHGAALSCSLPN